MIWKNFFTPHLNTQDRCREGKCNTQGKKRRKKSRGEGQEDPEPKTKKREEKVIQSRYPYKKEIQIAEQIKQAMLKESQ